MHLECTCAKQKTCYDITLSTQAGSKSHHLGMYHITGPDGACTGGLFMFGGPGWC